MSSQGDVNATALSMKLSDPCWPTVKLKVGADLINFRYNAPKDLVSLKNAISAVTGISAERMKIMVKGKLLKVSWTSPCLCFYY